MFYLLGKEDENKAPYEVFFYALQTGDATALIQSLKTLTQKPFQEKLEKRLFNQCNKIHDELKVSLEKLAKKQEDFSINADRSILILDDQSTDFPLGNSFSNKIQKDGYLQQVIAEINKNKAPELQIVSSDIHIPKIISWFYRLPKRTPSTFSQLNISEIRLLFYLHQKENPSPFTISLFQDFIEKEMEFLNVQHNITLQKMFQEIKMSGKNNVKNSDSLLEMVRNLSYQGNPQWNARFLQMRDLLCDLHVYVRTSKK